MNGIQFPDGYVEFFESICQRCKEKGKKPPSNGLRDSEDFRVRRIQRLIHAAHSIKWLGDQYLNIERQEQLNFWTWTPELNDRTLNLTCWLSEE